MSKVSTDSVWTQFSDRLRGFIARRIRGESDIEDILQEVFARIHAGLGDLKESEKLEAWLFQIARRAILDHFRSRSGKRRAAELEGDVAEEKPGATIPKEVASWLDPMMSLLSEEDRDALRLADLEGVSQKALASQLGLSVPGAKSRVQRARRRLKDAMLDCCHIEMDRRGNAIDYTRKRRDCGPCSCD
jgi:RNA polymerase sigma-70 factor (ECF subfamily)